MGIDNESRLFFGYILSDEDIQKIISKLSETDVEFTEDTLYDGEYDFGNEFTDLWIGYANPYYDCDRNERTYYISLFDTGLTELSVEELKKLLNWETTNYHKFLEYFGLEYRPPVMYAIPHIW